MMKMALLVVAMLAGCSLYSGDDGEPTSSEAVEQCRELVGVFCVAAETCGWDANTGRCRDYYGEMCESNRTLLNEQTFETSRFALTEYTCADNEAWILWDNDKGAAVLDAMLTW